MSSELAQPINIKDRVTEKIRQTFLDLIPEEAFQAMVQEEIQAFTVDRTERHGWNNNEIRTVKAPLRQIIEDEIRARFTEIVKAELDKPEYTTQYKINGLNGIPPVSSEFVEKVIQENLGAIVQAQYSSIFQHAVSAIRNSMNSLPPQY